MLSRRIFPIRSSAIFLIRLIPFVLFLGAFVAGSQGKDTGLLIALGLWYFFGLLFVDFIYEDEAIRSPTLGINQYFLKLTLWPGEKYI